LIFGPLGPRTQFFRKFRLSSIIRKRIFLNFCRIAAFELLAGLEIRNGNIILISLHLQGCHGFVA
jgi:hypothetical protein